MLPSSTWIRGKSDLEISEAHRFKRYVSLLIHGAIMKNMGNTLLQIPQAKGAEVLGYKDQKS